MRPNKLIDTKISTPLFNLPLQTIARGDAADVAARSATCCAGITWSLPSGQSDRAERCGAPALATA